MTEQEYSGPRLVCSTCAAGGERSVVHDPGGGWATAMIVHEYYDEDGRHHYHDPNTMSVTYSCSRGHRWTEGVRTACWCGYNAKSDPAQR